MTSLAGTWSIDDTTTISLDTKKKKVISRQNLRQAEYEDFSHFAGMFQGIMQR